MEPGALELQAGLGVALALVLVAFAVVLAGEGAELLMGGLVAVRGVLAPRGSGVRRCRG